VDWDSFSDDLEGLNFLDNLSCHRTNMALRVICSDDLGKEAVQEGLKQIKLKNVKTKPEMSSPSKTACWRCTAPMPSEPMGCTRTTRSGNS